MMLSSNQIVPRCEADQRASAMFPIRRQRIASVRDDKSVAVILPTHLPFAGCSGAIVVLN